MKRIFYVAICAATSFAIISCGNTNTTETTQQQAETNTIDNAIADSITKAKADSIAKIEAMEKAKADSIARAKADSLEKINNPHPDLKLFDLRGPVKSCKGNGQIGYDYQKSTLQYSPSGELSSVKIHEKGVTRTKIHRNDNTITKITYNHDISGDIYQCYTKYNIDNTGLCLNITRGDDYNDDWTSHIERDESKLITKCTRRPNSKSVENEFGYKTTTYKYLEFDKYGNWTKRQYHEKSISSKYADPPSNGTETRTITYYE